MKEDEDELARQMAIQVLEQKIRDHEVMIEAAKTRRRQVDPVGAEEYIAHRQRMLERDRAELRKE